MMRMRLLGLTIPIAMNVLGCSREPVVMSSASQALAKGMTGRWSVTFRLTASPVLNRDVMRLGEIHGQFALLENTSISGAYGGLPLVTDYGTYDIDFSPFGFDSPERGRPPQVIVGPATDDSVIVMLSPLRDDLSITMRGKAHADSVDGTWTVSFPRGGVGWGTFIMMRIP